MFQYAQYCNGFDNPEQIEIYQNIDTRTYLYFEECKRNKLCNWEGRPPRGLGRGGRPPRHRRGDGSGRGGGEDGGRGASPTPQKVILDK